MKAGEGDEEMHSTPSVGEPVVRAPGARGWNVGAIAQIPWGPARPGSLLSLAGCQEERCLLM